jgi:hypothetical protein
MKQLKTIRCFSTLILCFKVFMALRHIIRVLMARGCKMLHITGVEWSNACDWINGKDWIGSRLEVLGLLSVGVEGNPDKCYRHPQNFDFLETISWFWVENWWLGVIFRHIAMLVRENSEWWKLGVEYRTALTLNLPPTTIIAQPFLMFCWPSIIVT